MRVDTSRQLPRERLLTFGAEGLCTEDLVTVVVGSGTARRPAAAIARELLARTGGLAELARAGPRELAAIPGVGAAQAARLAAAFHLGRRAAQAEAVSRTDVVRSAADVYERMQPRLVGLAQEVFVVLAVDVRNRILEDIEVARGCLTGVDVHPREVFRPLIRGGAAAAIAVHNHPSGDPSPSPDDILLTRRLAEVGELVGIPLLDHVVVGATGYSSMAEGSWE